MVNHYLSYMIVCSIFIHIILFIINRPEISYEFLTGVVVCILAKWIVSYIILTLIEATMDLYSSY